MRRIVFVDTSVLTNVLDVPGKNGERDVVLPLFREMAQDGSTLIIPIAAIIEVGNHIAQLPGDDRRDRASRFEGFLRRSLDGKPPWVVSGASWDSAFLRELVDGHPRRPGMVALCTSRVGTGDGSILLEVERYRQRSDVPSAVPIELWSLDQGLSTYGAALLAR